MGFAQESHALQHQPFFQENAALNQEICAARDDCDTYSGAIMSGLHRVLSRLSRRLFPKGEGVV